MTCTKQNGECTTKEHIHRVLLISDNIKPAIRRTTKQKFLLLDTKASATRETIQRIRRQCAYWEKIKGCLLSEKYCRPSICSKFRENKYSRVYL